MSKVIVGLIKIGLASAVIVADMPLANAHDHINWSVSIGSPVYAPPVVYSAPPVVYSAPPVVYTSPPVVYAPPPPVVYQPALPVYSTGYVGYTSGYRWRHGHHHYHH